MCTHLWLAQNWTWVVRKSGSVCPANDQCLPNRNISHTQWPVAHEAQHCWAIGCAKIAIQYGDKNDNRKQETENQYEQSWFAVWVSKPIRQHATLRRLAWRKGARISLRSRNPLKMHPVCSYDFGSWNKWAQKLREEHVWVPFYAFVLQSKR
jgi:hypothetical protein